MLDEIREWEQVALPLGEGESFRLKHRNLSDGLSGAERAMTVIARRFLCGAAGEPELLAEATVFEKVKTVSDVLRAWCGYEQEMPEGLTAEGEKVFLQMKNRLTTGICQLALEQAGIRENQKYLPMADAVCSRVRETLERCSGQVSLKEALECFAELSGMCARFREEHPEAKGQIYPERLLTGALEPLRDREISFGKPAVTEISFDLYAKGNSFKIMNFERIAAAALDLGPLKRYVVLSDQGNFCGEVYRKTAQKVKQISLGDLDTVPRLVFAWLRERSLHGGGARRMEIINTADVINWCKGIPHLEKSKRDLYLYLGDKEKRLFTVPQYGEEEKGGNTIKIGLYPEFFDKWADALCLVEDSPEAIRAWKAAHPGGAYVLWRDRGACRDLQVLCGEEIFRTEE